MRELETELPEVTGIGAKVGNVFFSVTSWFSDTFVNENFDDTTTEPPRKMTEWDKCVLNALGKPFAYCDSKIYG